MRNIVVCATFITMMIFVTATPSKAQEVSEYLSYIKCNGMDVRISIKCPHRNELSPYDCSNTNIAVNGKEVISKNLELPNNIQGFVPSFWICHEEKSKTAVVIDFGNGGNCDTCEVYLWVLRDGELLTEDEAAKIFTEDVNISDFQPVNHPLSTLAIQMPQGGEGAGLSH